MFELPKVLNWESTRQGFARGLVEAAREDERIVVIGLDVSGSLFLQEFKQAFPERFISLGIAEQNGAAVAAGLAMNGLKPVFATYATFATTRALDQIRVSICYNDAPVLLVGAHAGLSVGPDGATHQALEDIATMRVLPGMRVAIPCDSNEAQAATRSILLSETIGPTYLRLGRAATENYTSPTADYRLGQWQAYGISSSPEVVIFACGGLVYPSLRAANQMRAAGIAVEVVNVSSAKPLDAEVVIRYMRIARAYVVVEEHQSIGGVGSAIAELTAQYGGKHIEFMGVADSFGESGTPEELLEAYGLASDHIASRAAAVANTLRMLGID